MKQYIESEQNKWLKKIKALQQKKYRQQYNQFLVEGLRFLAEARQRQASIEAILVAEDALSAAETILDGYEGPLLVVKKGLLEKTLSTVSPQGVAAIVDKPNWSQIRLEDLHTVLLVDGVQDPGNLGTIIRTALASGTEAIYLLKGTVDLYNDKVLRATMGAIFALPVLSADDHEALLKALKEAGFATVLSDIRGKHYYDQIAYPKRTALIVSNEANGPQLIRQSDYSVKIPLHGAAESLNVAVACAILLYELERRQRQPEADKS